MIYLVGWKLLFVFWELPAMNYTPCWPFVNSKFLQGIELFIPNTVTIKLNNNLYRIIKNLSNYEQIIFR